MDNANKHKSREYDWHPTRSWMKRYNSDIKKFYF